MHNKSAKESAIKNTNLSNKDGYLTINMAAQVNMLVSSHNHIKITPKLQNNHYSILPEIKMNGSPTTTELKKKLLQDCQEGQRGGDADLAGPTPTCGRLKSGGISQE